MFLYMIIILKSMEAQEKIPICNMAKNNEIEEEIKDFANKMQDM